VSAYKLIYNNNTPEFTTMENVTMPQTTEKQNNQSQLLTWEKPVLLKEEWMNTLSGTDPAFEDPSFYAS
jgi:hypothetical protein